MTKQSFKPNIEEDLNRLHNVSLTEGQISIILYILEGYNDTSNDPDLPKELDNMDTQSLYELASEYVTQSFDRLTDSEIKERIESLYDEELYDELVDNVTSLNDNEEP